MAAVRKMLIPLATRMGVSDPQQSVHKFFQTMQKEVLKFHQSVSLLSLSLSLCLSLRPPPHPLRRIQALKNSEEFVDDVDAVAEYLWTSAKKGIVGMVCVPCLLAPPRGLSDANPNPNPNRLTGHPSRRRLCSL